MIVELHLLQSFPVSNLNRDDVGQPKSATFGGFPRARISSQSLKRAARLLFPEYGLGEAETGIRTKRLVDEAAKALTERGRDSGEVPMHLVTTAALEALGFGVDSRTRLTQYLLFVGRDASRLLADFCEHNWDRLYVVAQERYATEQKTGQEAKKSKKAADDKAKKIKPDRGTLAEARRILDARRVADIALFGRMIADNKDFNVDAASQVAHAISTHAVANEFDYYTAVDDLKPEEEAGADMIGTVDFNTACYYRYANVDTDQLLRNLDGDADLAARTIKAWLLAFIHAVPGGKQNSMAARTLPETLLGVVRQRGAWNLANAFLRPVSGEDLMAASTQKLLDHFVKLRDFYGGDDMTVVGASVTGELPELDGVERVSKLDDFVNKLVGAVTIQVSQS